MIARKIDGRHRDSRAVDLRVPPYWSARETIIGYLGAVGIRMKLRTLERAAFQPAWAGKKLHGICMCTMANVGNAATRLAEAVQSHGAYARGADPDVDALYKQQARETDRRKREAVRIHLGERDRVARGGAGADAHRSVPVVGAPRSRAAEGQMSTID